MNKFIKKLQSNKIIFILILGTIILFGSFIRLWGLSENPPGLQYDEAYNGLDGLKAMETGDYQIFYNENNGREGLYINALAVSMKVFGVDNFSIRLVSALFGIFTLVGFYFLLKELKFSRLSILLGVLLLSTSFWHINFSHTVYRAIMVPFLLVWLFYFFFLGIRTLNNWYFVVSGLLLGVGFHTYISFRVAPLILVLMMPFFLFYKTKFFKKYWRGALIFIVSAFLAAAPLLWYFYGHQDDLVGRSNAVSVFNAPNLSFPEALTKSVIAHINAFYFYGDPNQRHNHAGSPLIPPAWTVLFTIGFAFSLKEIIFHIFHYKKKRVLDPLFRTSLLAHGIFWVMLIPGILSIEGIPHSLRIIGTIPAVMIFIIIPFEYILRLRENLQKSKTLSLKPWRWKMLNISLAGLVVIVSLAGLMEAYTYHFIWSKEPKTLEAFEGKLYDFGKISKQIALKDKNILVIPEDVHIGYKGMTSAFKTTEFSGYPEIREFRFKHPLEAVKDLTESECSDSNYVFFDADKWLLDQFKEQCENFEAEKIKPVNGYYEFWFLKN
jgi:4-amino-4-deoxy-L-arabinose transferase-like glycosyltransferase